MMVLHKILLSSEEKMRLKKGEIMAEVCVFRICDTLEAAQISFGT